VRFVEQPALDDGLPERRRQQGGQRLRRGQQRRGAAAGRGAASSPASSVPIIRAARDSVGGDCLDAPSAACSATISRGVRAATTSSSVSPGAADWGRASVRLRPATSARKLPSGSALSMRAVKRWPTASSGSSAEISCTAETGLTTDSVSRRRRAARSLGIMPHALPHEGSAPAGRYWAP